MNPLVLILLGLGGWLIAKPAAAPANKSANKPKPQQTGGGLGGTGLTTSDLVGLTVGGLGRVGGGAGLIGPGHQLVGLAGHGRDHHGHVEACTHLGRHQPRHATDPLQVGHRSAPEFHRDDRHICPKLCGGLHKRGRPRAQPLK